MGGAQIGKTIQTAILCLALASLGATGALAETGVRATYLANAGVMVEYGGAKVLFDPLFRLSHDYYRSVPATMENGMLNGDPPFDGVDVVLVTHFHLDHFSPNLLLNYLMINPDATLFAPEQALDAMRRYAADEEAQLMERVTVLNLSHFGEPFHQDLGEIVIESVRIPHSGWPDANRGTQNLAYRVTLQGEATVIHLGDAAPQADLFDKFENFWGQRRAQLVLAPYWFLLDADGLRILQSSLGGAAAVGIHVPSEVQARPELRRPEYRDLDLFTSPGETRTAPPTR